MLQVEQVAVRFGGVQALSDVSFTAEAGAVTGLIGPNGAGKTTTFNVVTGLQRPLTGCVRFGGEDITRLTPQGRAKRGIARTYQRVEVFGSLSVRDNVQVAVEVHGGWKARRSARVRANELIEQVGLEAVADVATDLLPTGMARLVEVARALAARPQLVLFDEVGSGLSVPETERLGELLASLTRDGVAVLLVEHDMDLVMSVCTQLFVLDFGELISEGSPAVVQADPRVQEAYLGLPSSDVADRERTPPRDNSAWAGDTEVTEGVPDTRSAHEQGLEVAALELRGVCAGYDKVEVLHGIDLVVPPKSVVALLGPNGAGKTTIMRIASRRITPFAGQVLFDGQDVGRRSPEKLAQGGVCAIPEGRAVFPNLTVAENLRMWTFRGGLRLASVEEAAYERFPRLAERRKQLAGSLSGGEQQMLAMSRALSTNPRVLLLDEISMGLAPIVVARLYEIVEQLAAEGLAILLVEQFAYTALQVASTAAIVANGRIETQGPPDQIREALVQTYLRSTPNEPNPPRATV